MKNSTSHLLKISDLSKSDVEEIVSHAFEFKNGKQIDLKKQVVAMVFEKPSLRTKIAFEVAATQMNAIPVFLTSQQILASGQQERGRESIPDIAKNLERFSDIIVARVYDHATLIQMADSIHIPVVNALCDLHHPTQALADLMAIQWHKPDITNLKVAYVGDGANVAHSLKDVCKLMGIEFVSASPAGYELSDAEVVINPLEAVIDADVVYTDTFISMGLEGEKAKRVEVFKEYQVNKRLLDHASQDAVFMHCMPAHRGEEVTDEVMDCEQSIVFDQAACRLYIAKAVLQYYLQ